MTAPRDPRLLVVALGDEAVPGVAAPTPDAWLRGFGASLPAVVDLVAAGFRLVLTHGSVPRVGDAWLRAELARARVPSLTLDLCTAEAQGAVGYAMAQVLASLGRARGVDVPAAAVVTRVVVDPRDPAFERPARPIGPVYPAAQGRRLARERGWTVAEEAGRGLRRVVPGPRPARVVEVDAVRRLVEAGIVPIVAGGGGVPVLDAPVGYQGVEAVVEPDETAALLATALAADRLLFLTGVDQLAVGFGTPRAIGIERLTAPEARALLGAGEFAARSMGPKVEAAIAFVEAGGREAIVTVPGQARAALDGQAGTRILS